MRDIPSKFCARRDAVRVLIVGCLLPARLRCAVRHVRARSSRLGPVVSNSSSMVER